MTEVLSQKEIDQLLAAVNGTEDRKPADGPGWPVVIDYQTFCSRLDSYGFNDTNMALAKTALLEAELAYRFWGGAKGA